MTKTKRPIFKQNMQSMRSISDNA